MSHWKTCIFVFLSLLLTAEWVHGQRKPHRKARTYHTKERHSTNATRMSRKKAKIVCPVFENSQYPYQGLGIKLGDPFAITYKYYFNENFAVVADFGKASSGLYNRYFREKFYEDIPTDTLQESAQIEYLTHKVKSDWIAEVKFLWHFDASAISNGLKVYVGVGAESKSTRLEYQYFYYPDPDDRNTNELGQVDKRRITYGPQAVAGIEYSYFQIPISAFMEVEFFQDVSLDPGWQRFEGGVGLRYIF